MQTNTRLFTDRHLPGDDAVAERPTRRLSSPDEDAAGGLLEAVAHAALVLILLGALGVSGHSPAASPDSARLAAPSANPPVPVAASSPAAAFTATHCL